MKYEILPTHTCFDDAVDIMNQFAKDNDRDAVETALVVHAVCLLDDGQRYAHGWVELNGRCLFCGLIDGKKITLSAESMKEFYKELKVQQVTKYSVEEIFNRKFHLKTSPWEEPYKSLCRNTINQKQQHGEYSSNR